MAKKSVFDYPGERASVSWDGRLCIHVAECGRATGDLFVGGRKPWCQPDLATEEEVVEVVSRCPSGALSIRFADGTNPENAPTENTLHVTCNGPLFVRGDLNIDGISDDAPGLRFRAALCRCGHSGNKPFCDNSHEKAGFRDYGAVGDTGSGVDGPGGPLSIKPVKDGPLLLKGNLAVFSSGGRRAWSGNQAAFCRCGNSANKPFCDGSHKATGFRSEQE